MAIKKSMDDDKFHEFAKDIIYMHSAVLLTQIEVPFIFRLKLMFNNEMMNILKVGPKKVWNSDQKVPPRTN
jgi:hypothetical protein